MEIPASAGIFLSLKKLINRIKYNSGTIMAGPFKYGKHSKAVLKTVHPKLQIIMEELIKVMDVSLISGYRGKEEQDSLYYARPPKTKLRYPKSKHNSRPSRAIDVIPYPSGYSDRQQLAFMVGAIKAIAKMKGIKIISGADWDDDNDFTDHTFLDWPHVELHDDED